MTKETYDLINFQPKSELEDGYEFTFDNCSIDEIPLIERLVMTIENEEAQINLAAEYFHITKDYENGITKIKFFK